jgi:hypothetical protein
MTPEDAAVATADAVSGITSRFMLDPSTYIHGGGLGFEGMSFYTGGRGGVLGDVTAEDVTKAFHFFHPEQVATNWTASESVMPRDKAAQEFANCAANWAEAKLPDDLDCARLAELAEKVGNAAGANDIPMVAGWKKLPVPSSPKAAAVFHMNTLRELRFALHAKAVAAQGIEPSAAVLHRQPYMYAMFGWGDIPENPEPIAADWDKAEAQTNAEFAKALAVLSESELEEFVTLANAANAATQ